MSVSSIVAMGFGSFGGVEFLPTLGFSSGEAVAVLELPLDAFVGRVLSSSSRSSRSAAASQYLPRSDQAQATSEYQWRPLN